MKKSRLGYAFSEEVIRVKGQRSSLKGQNTDSWKDQLIPNFSGQSSDQTSRSRVMSLLVIFLLIFAGLFIRLFHLTITQGAEWRTLADSNRIKVKVIHAPRGVIYDRYGVVLAQNNPGFRLNIASGSAHAQTISRDQALKMEVDHDPNYQNLEIDSIRSYPLGPVTAHLIGYMGEITDSELKSQEYSNYKLGDLIGRGGIEQSYEKTLKGIDGGQVIEVDSEGRELRVLRQTDPIPGQNVYLTIDSNLQQELYKDLSEGVKKVNSCCGAAVAEDPMSGQILALASIPSFDPKDLDPALTDPNSPFLDRAIAGEYPPGSTFKIASALAGLSSGKITPQTQFDDTGVLNLGPYSFANWYFTEYGRKEGLVDIEKAIQRSNDIFFYHVGEEVGEEYLAQTARKLGLGTVLGIDIPGEEPGLIPDDNWKKKNIGVAWYPGDTLHMAIGQGYVLSTPLQILNLISVVASGGREYPPHLALKITGPDNSLIKLFKFNSFSNLDFKTSDINLVRQGLDLVPKYGGTAWPFFTFTVPTSGKTGTAEFGDQNKTHAWYTSYAPSDNPKIALTVLVEGGGEGSNTSAPIAKQVYTWYFSKDKNHLTNFDNYAIATDSAKVLGE